MKATKPSNAKRPFQSWGRYPQTQSYPLHSAWSSDPIPTPPSGNLSLLPYGLGRSYGDSCINAEQCLIDCTAMNKLLAFDEQSGVLKAEAGISLDEILMFCVPRGWFLPVTPGTKFVTLGGAIANDVHGKNHHVDGNFGNSVLSIELLRSDSSRHICSESQNADLFRATIGGLGLTGLVTWAEFKLKPILSSAIQMDSIKVENLEEFLQLTEESDKNFAYTVSWLDCLAKGKDLGRGVFMRGNHSEDTAEGLETHKKTSLSVPFELPNFLLNKLSIKTFNTIYYNRQSSKLISTTTKYDPFFYPLDSVDKWNRIYGRRGFFQYQFVVPFTDGQQSVLEIMDVISKSGQGSFLAVLKTFGDIEGKGMLSFPRPGITVALDFPNRHESTMKMMSSLDAIVMEAGGRIYPAKDARMSPEVFRSSFPNWEAFSHLIDPKFSSSFWRRVTEEN